MIDKTENNTEEMNMPSNVVKTPEDKLDWAKAKAAVEKELGHKLDQKHMPLVMHIFETIKASHLAQSQPQDSSAQAGQEPGSPDDQASAAKALLLGRLGKKKSPPMVQDADSDSM